MSNQVRLQLCAEDHFGDEHPSLACAIRRGVEAQHALSGGFMVNSLVASKLGYSYHPRTQRMHTNAMSHLAYVSPRLFGHSLALWHWQISSKKLPLFDSLTLFEEWTCPATPAQPCCWERKQPKGRISIQLQACSRFVFSGFSDIVPPRVVLPGTSRCSNEMQ